jgi:hypothetical protein
LLFEAIPGNEMSTDRVFLDRGIDELEGLMDDYGDDELFLLVLAHELSHRRIQRSRDLAQVALEKLIRQACTDEAFEWPSTEVLFGDGSIDSTAEWRNEGVLKFVGYSVGRTRGLPESRRREILHMVYLRDLPHQVPSDLREAWGTRASCGRLLKLANTLASFIRNAKRRSESIMRFAISDWDSDLAYLKSAFYDGGQCQRTFVWPRTGV